ncbi:uncharacterized protein DEA37_0001009, partial [Paragonimus westermani]
MNEIYKIRLSHDGTGPYPEWFVAEVRMRQLSITPSCSTIPNLTGSRLTKKQRTELETLSTLGSAELVFPCMQWLSRSKADGSLTREMAAPGTQLGDLRAGYSLCSRTIVLDPLELAVYGNRAPDEIMEDCLRHSQDAGVDLLPGERLTDLDYAEDKVLLFDNFQAAQAMLDAISSSAKYFGMRFAVYRVICYQLCVTTGQLWNAGTTADVRVLLQGDRGDTGIRSLYNPTGAPQRNFVRGQTSIFQLEAVYLGRLRRLSIWLDGEDNEETEWFLDRIVIRELMTLARTQWTFTPSPSMHGNLMNHSSVRTLGTSYFPCYQWLKSNSEPTHAGGLLTNLLSTVVPSTEEEDCHLPMQYGSPVTFFIVSSNPLEHKPGRTLKRHTNQSSDYIPRSRSDLGVPTPLERDVERFNTKHNTECMVRQFYSLQNQWMKLSLDEAIGLCVTDERLASTRADDENTQFRVRAQPDHWIALETVSRFADLKPAHVYIGPDGCVVSGAAGPLSLPGKLLMPHVKGTLRDQSIVWLCTSSEQTVVPVLRGKTDPTESGMQRTYDPVNEWNFELRATGSRNKDAYWRVQRIDRRVRQFEAVAWPGHYLRVIDGHGSGGPDCHFRVERRRSKGFIQLSPLSSLETYVGMEEDGTLALFAPPNTENTRFCIEVIKFGIPKQLSDSPEKSVVLDGPTCLENPNEPLKPLPRETIVKPLELSKSGSLSASTNKEAEDEDLLDRELQFFPKLIDSKDLSERDWKVSIATCSTAKNCNVLLFVYGLQANSGPILIGQSEDEKYLFRSNSTDSFMVVLENYVTGERLSFDFTDRPIGRNPNFCQLSREQAFDESASALKTHLLYDSQDSLSAIQDMDVEFNLVLYRARLELQSDPEWTKRHPSFEPHISLVGKYGDSGRRMLPISQQVCVGASEREGVS